MAVVETDVWNRWQGPSVGGVGVQGQVRDDVTMTGRDEERSG